MIDPIIYTIRIGDFALSLHWYGVLVVTSILVGTWIAEREMRRRGENSDYLWDGLAWAILAGIVGARLWYVANDILGGGTRYLAEPIRILYIPEGGLHIYGAFLFGGLAYYVYSRRHKLDMRLILDSVAPSLLIGQGIARLGNLINQELYGPPTSLPWGISISAPYRIPPWNDLARFPEATTRFHPTFAYEMLWNFLAAGLLLWIGRRYEKKLKPGTSFAGWMILAGIGRVIIEFWRPDQPRIPGTDLSYSRLVAACLAIGGLIWVLARYKVIRLPFLFRGHEAYILAPTEATTAEPKPEIKEEQEPGQEPEQEPEEPLEPETEQET